MKSKSTAAILALILGTFGLHRFYLKQYILGILYVIFFWTYIPTIISIIDAIIFWSMSEYKFNLKYNNSILPKTQPKKSVTPPVPNKVDLRDLIKVTITTSSNERNNKDNGVIDVTGREYKIPSKNFTTLPSIEHSNVTNSSYNDYDPEEFKLGKKYKEKLGLTTREVSWLNKFYNPNNVFLDIEGCCISTIKLYLAILKELNTRLKQKETTLSKEVEIIKETGLKLYESKNYYSWNAYDISFYKQRIESDIYQTIFKRAENTIRNSFEHKRKISTEYPNAEIINLFEFHLGSLVNEIIPKLFSTISPPDEQTEIGLNTQNVSRWKMKLENITSGFSESTKQDFFDSVVKLGKLNEKNPSVENIFFEASKFVAKYNKEISLKLYIYYLYYDIKSEKFDNKQLAKTIQKSLFSTNNEIQEFEKIANDLIKNSNLEKALSEVSQIYIPKRKRIQLDTSAIQEVQKQHSGTVDLLNEYLHDEQEQEEIKVPVIDVESKEEIKLSIAPLNSNSPANSIYINDISLNPTQSALIELFVSNNFCIDCKALDEFAKGKGAFKNQLIDSINENCYEVLDDVLIEEDGENYLINESYYQKIISK